MKERVCCDLFVFILALAISLSSTHAAVVHPLLHVGGRMLCQGDRPFNIKSFKSLLPSLIVSSRQDACFINPRSMMFKIHEEALGPTDRNSELAKAPRPRCNHGFLYSTASSHTSYYDEAKLTPSRLHEDALLNKDVLFSAPDVLQSRTSRYQHVAENSPPAAIVRVSPEDSERLSQWHGTTTLSLRVQGGIVIAVDSRASIGSFVGSHTTKKVLPITSHIVATMAGGAADCQHILREISGLIRVIEAEMNDRSVRSQRGSLVDVSRKLIDVGFVARMLARKLRTLRSEDISMGTMISGYDRNGPSLFYIDDSGNCIKGSCFSVGSGSLIANSILQSEYSDPEHKNLSPDSSNDYATVESGISLALRAVRHAIHRDCYSGGYINVFLVNSTGCHHVVRKHFLEIDL